MTKKTTHTEPTDNDLELMVVDAAASLLKRAIRVRHAFETRSTITKAQGLAIRKARRAVREANVRMAGVMETIANAEAELSRERAAAAPESAPVVKATPRALPEGVQEAIRRCQQDLTPKQSRQLDTLVRKRMGVPDPKPEQADDADGAVIELANGIARAAVAGYIQRIHGGDRGG